MRWIYIVFLLLLSFQVFPKNTKKLSVQEIMDSMSDEEKVAQLITVRTYAPEPVEDIFKIFVPGGFIYHKKYPSTKKGYLSRIQRLDFFNQASIKKYSLPPLQMIDQEGCSVNRFPNTTYLKKSFHLAGAPKLGATKDLSLVQQFGEDLGRYLFLFGYNMNLAPVVDIYDASKKQEYIAQRSIKENPVIVQNVSQAFTQGLQKQNVIATFKHFPGYSAAHKNSHNEVVHISISKKEIMKKHLVPYYFRNKSTLPYAIMSNIAIYDHLDSSSTATLSKKIIQDLLRGELKYKGLIVSDDIGMKGYKEKNLVQRAIKAILSGHDVILLAADFSNKEMIQIHQALIREFRKNDIFRGKVLESVKRVIQLKKKLRYNSLSTQGKLKSVLKHERKLYSTNNLLSEKIIKNYFDKNPDLKGIFSEQRVILFSKNKEYFSKKSSKVLRSSLSKKDKKLLFLLDDPNTFGICMDRGVSYCQKYATNKQKKSLLIVDSKCRPDSRLMKARYKAVIPTYGRSEVALKLILDKLSNR